MLVRSNRPSLAKSTNGGASEQGVQSDRQPRGNAAAVEAMNARASGGASGGGLPFMDQIQCAFGRHDVSGIKGAVGGEEGRSAARMGAEAYASGESVVFQATPDLHTAAHEASHVVQQRNGVSKPGGVGSVGDEHEREADAIADLVVAGKSAESRLGGKGAGKAPAGKTVQKLEEKKVSSGSARRLEYARAAIKHTKEVIAFGAGNQADALKSSNFNSYYRMKAMRDPECWEMSSSVRAIAAQHPDALTAAKADLAGGGNCGEHAQIGFDFLRVTAIGETLNRSDVEGLDHAFCIMGDMKKDTDSSLTVCDPWPTEATACLWEDHFAFNADRTKINIRQTEKADGSDVKSVIAAGLKLSRKGEAMIKQRMTDEQTDEQIKSGTSSENGAHPWIWSHSPTASTEYDYQEDSSL